jgi:hypothetical protein
MNIQNIRQSVIVLVGCTVVISTAHAQRHVVLQQKWEGFEGIEWIDFVGTNAAATVTNGISLSISTDKSHYWVHDSVTLNVILKNIDQENVSAIGGPLFTPKNIYVLLPGTARRTRETEYCADPRNLHVGSTFGVNLRPGEEHMEPVEINRLLDMTPSGEYRIFVRREVSLLNPERKMTLQTPAILIHIDDNPPKDEQLKK